MAAARQRNVGGSLAAARRQWQRQRRWRQRDSTTSAVAVAAAHQRDVGGSMAAAWRWRQREAQQRCTARQQQRGCSSVDASAVAAACQRDATIYVVVNK